MPQSLISSHLAFPFSANSCFFDLLGSQQARGVQREVNEGWGLEARFLGLLATFFLAHRSIRSLLAASSASTRSIRSRIV